MPGLINKKNRLAQKEARRFAMTYSTIYRRASTVIPGFNS